ncbi:9496_t:CDS:2 [Racocetra persica]|uniref:9496_t:CDS:1 n=1 Tax=Racocetra persica TaxID=160502 RepID=A0ACA9MQC4_9GLOM|nr:9496_t:CDS:2 [Racocetra persica]
MIKNIGKIKSTTKYREAQKIRKTYEVSSETLRRTIQRSWYSVRMSTLMIQNPESLPRIYYPSLLSSQQDTMDSDQLRTGNDKEKLKTRKIQIYPTLEEREKLRKWMGTVRWTYNKVLEMLQDDKDKMKYKTKKDRLQTISILARDWNRNRGEYAFLKTVIVSKRPPEINHTVNVIMNRLGHFYMCISIPLNISNNQDGVKGKVISLDPGVHTFMTGYDPNGRVVEWGNGDI